MVTKRHYFPLLLLLFTLTGCSSEPKQIQPSQPQHPTLSVSIEASSTINPDGNSRPSPLVIRLYQLRSNGVFENSDFFSLYDNEISLLGKDISSRDELEIAPGEHFELSRELAAETRYIGVISAYRNIENARWKSSIPVSQNQAFSARVRLDRLSTSVIPQ